ncbi:MAG: ABC1 kinase family protein [Bacteriovoracaceae bacterium]
MDLIRTGIGITKTIRNASRLKEIVSIFARHGFDELFSRALSNKVPNLIIPKSKEKSILDNLDDESGNLSKVIGSRLRQCFEELGSTFIKFGQLLGSREDLFDKEFIDEMLKLRDQVKSVPLSELRGDIENSLGAKIEDVFDSIDEKAIGTASIGIVFKAKLKDGKDVVLKVRRPNIRKQIEMDFSIVIFLVSQLEKVSDEIKFLGVSRILEDFSQSLTNELNFNIEALNCDRIRKIIAKQDHKDLFSIPKVYDEYTSEKLLVMEFMEGVSFSSGKIFEYSEELQPKLEYGITIFIKSFLEDGFFHADLHGGNFFYRPDGKIGLIDFGLVGSLGKKGRKNFVAIIYALLTFNYENLVYEFLDVADYEQIPDVDVLIQDVRGTLSPYVGLTVQQTDFADLLQKIVKTLNKHRIYLPREWFIVFRALMTLDGVGKSLKFDLDLFELLEDDIKEIASNSISKDDIVEELLWFGKDFSSSARTIPRHIRWFLREWSKRGYRFELTHTGHEKAADRLAKAIVVMGLIVACSILSLAGVFLVENKFFKSFSDVPLLAWALWFLSFVGFIQAMLIGRKIVK